MATFHSGSEGQTQKLQALRRRQKRLAFRAVIVPPVCWGICAASAPWWFPPLKETLGVRFDAQTQGWILLVLILLMISLPVLISLHLKRRARGAKYAATLVSSGIRGEEDARDAVIFFADEEYRFYRRVQKDACLDFLFSANKNTRFLGAGRNDAPSSAFPRG